MVWGSGELSSTMYCRDTDTAWIQPCYLRKKHEDAFFSLQPSLAPGQRGPGVPCKVGVNPRFVMTSQSNKSAPYRHEKQHHSHSHTPLPPSTSGTHTFQSLYYTATTSPPRKTVGAATTATINTLTAHATSSPFTTRLAEKVEKGGTMSPESLSPYPPYHGQDNLRVSSFDHWYPDSDFRTMPVPHYCSSGNSTSNSNSNNSSTTFSPSSSYCCTAVNQKRELDEYAARDPLSHFSPMVICGSGSDNSSQNENTSAYGGGSAGTGSAHLGGGSKISDAEAWLETGTRTQELEKINYHLHELKELRSENMKNMPEPQNMKVVHLPIQDKFSIRLQDKNCNYPKMNISTMPSTLHPKQRRNSKIRKNRKPFDEAVETKLYDVDEFAEIVIGFVIRYCQKQEEKWQKGEDCLAVLKPDLVQGIKIRNMNWTSEDDSGLPGDDEEGKKRIPKAEKIRVKAKRTMKAIVEKNGEQMAERVNNDPELYKQRDIWRTMNCGLALAAMKSEWGNDAIVRNIDIDAQFKYLFDYKNTISANKKNGGDFKLERPKLQNFFRYLAEHPRSGGGNNGQADDGALDIIVWECSRTESRVATREHRRKYYKNELAVQMRAQAHSELYGI